MDLESISEATSGAHLTPAKPGTCRMYSGKQYPQGTTANLILAAAAVACTAIATQYTVFDQLKQRAPKGKQDNSSKGSSPESLSALSAFVLGAVSKTVATVLTYPAIRCKVMIQAADPDDENKTKEARRKTRKTIPGTPVLYGNEKAFLAFSKVCTHKS